MRYHQKQNNDDEIENDEGNKMPYEKIVKPKFQQKDYILSERKLRARRGKRGQRIWILAHCLLYLCVLHSLYGVKSKEKLYFSIAFGFWKCAKLFTRSLHLFFLLRHFFICFALFVCWFSFVSFKWNFENFMYPVIFCLFQKCFFFFIAIILFAAQMRGRKSEWMRFVSLNPINSFSSSS